MKELSHLSLFSYKVKSYCKEDKVLYYPNKKERRHQLKSKTSQHACF